MSPTQSPSDVYPHSVLIAGVRVSHERLVLHWQAQELQALLNRARSHYSYALCGCRPAEQLRLQIRTRDGKSHLAVWPEEGPKHDVRCIFFRDAMAATALEQGEESPATAAPVPAGGVEAQALLPPYAQEVQRTRVRLIRPGQERIPGEQGLSVRSLAYRLWEAASLCRWHPSWTRDWGRVRYQLRQAAERFTLDGQPAENLLFMPRVYRPEIQDKVDREWDSFLRELQGAPDTPHILVAPVRGFVEASQDKPGALRLRHLRHPIGLFPACHDFLMRECRSALSNSRIGAAPAYADSRPELVAILSVEASRRGGVWARSGWLMGVHQATYIPAGNADSIRLIDALVGDGHVFEHLLSEVQSSQRYASEWLLRHVRDPHGVPVARAALEVLSPGSSAQFLQARASIANRMQEQGMPTWTWMPTGYQVPVPPLPPLDTSTPAQTQAALAAIRANPTAEYRYGALAKLFPDFQLSQQTLERTFA